MRKKLSVFTVGLVPPFDQAFKRSRRAPEVVVSTLDSRTLLLPLVKLRLAR